MSDALGFVRVDMRWGGSYILALHHMEQVETAHAEQVRGGAPRQLAVTGPDGEAIYFSTADIGGILVASPALDALWEERRQRARMNGEDG